MEKTINLNPSLQLDYENKLKDFYTFENIAKCLKT